MIQKHFLKRVENRNAKFKLYEKYWDQTYEKIKSQAESEEDLAMEELCHFIKLIPKEIKDYVLRSYMLQI